MSTKGACSPATAGENTVKTSMQVKYAMGLVDPMYKFMAPEGLSDVEKHEAELRRVSLHMSAEQDPSGMCELT